MTASHHDDVSRPTAARRSPASDPRPTPPCSDRDTAAQTLCRNPEPLLSVRTTVVLLLATFAGIVAGVLAGLGEQPLPAAALVVGGGAAGGALALFHSLIERR
jgi:hypothetical protein